VVLLLLVVSLLPAADFLLDVDFVEGLLSGLVLGQLPQFELVVAQLDPQLLLQLHALQAVH
jgi:hypothetical protein